MSCNFRNQQKGGIYPFFHVYCMYRNAFAFKENWSMIYYMPIIHLKGILFLISDVNCYIVFTIVVTLCSNLPVTALLVIFPRKMELIELKKLDFPVPV